MNDVAEIPYTDAQVDAVMACYRKAFQINVGMETVDPEYYRQETRELLAAMTEAGITVTVPTPRDRQTCPDCDPASHVRVSVEGRMAFVDRARFPGAQIWDLALYAADYAGDPRPGKGWEYRDNHGVLHGWDTHMQDFPHEDLHVVPRAGTGA